ncbi:hypothetical protein TrVFT333_009552 [Trichoderma virens FT-333]|nr:hypothetical protein TrVFT333_009552 [Trichoderma virens FT-333]
MDSQSPKKFQLFPYLPFELREMIWKAAIRPQERGAQFFTFSNSSDCVLASLAVLASDTLTAKTPNLTISLDDDNVSSYMIDSGLWNACSESSMILQKEVAKRRWFGQDSRTGHFTSGSGLDRYLTYSPRDDLICFQHQDLKKLLEWEWNEVYSVPPFLREYHANVALEYDQRWQYFFHEGLPVVPYRNRKTMQGILFRACHKVAAGKLWLIDYRVQPKANIPKEKQSIPDLTFHANGKRFVSVDNETMWDFQGSTCQAFARRLDAAIQFYASFTAFDIPDFLWRAPGRVGILACIE